MKSIKLISFVLVLNLIVLSCSQKTSNLSDSQKIKQDSINQNYYKYIHKEPLSFASRTAQIGLSILNFKKKSSNYFKQELLKGDLKDNSKDKKSFNIPSWLIKNHSVKIDTIDGRKVVTLSPKKINKTNQVVVYLHGGAYVSNISSLHWRMIDILASKSGSTFIVPDYPLAPNNKCKEVISFIDKVYNKVNNDFLNHKIALMGDSAGAGLSLAFALTIKNQIIKQPNQLILLSPWVDLTHSNPKIKDYEKNDKMLSVAALNNAAKLYQGELGLRDYRVSPIYGNFSNLSTTSIFIGTHDIFLPDSRKLKDLLVSKNVRTNYYEYLKSFHVWPALYFTREAKSAHKQIIEKLIN